MKIILFAYDFPHRRSQDFIIRLFLEGYEISGVIAAPWRPLPIAGETVRTKIRRRDLCETRLVAERMGIPYYSQPHDAPETVALLRALRPDLGVVAGARILPAPVIHEFGTGIINFHLGLIPENRGLDAMLWAVHKDLPQAITTHFIDERIDAGRIIRKSILPLFADDTPLDISERLHETQLMILGSVLDEAMSLGPKAAGEVVEPPEGSYHGKMPADLEGPTLAGFADYVARQSAAGCVDHPPS